MSRNQVSMPRTTVASLGIPSTKNFIPNPSFEYDADGSTTLTGWTINSANAAQNVSTTFAKFGTKSIKLIPSGGVKNYFYCDVEYGLNQVYVLTFWSKCTAYSSGTPFVAIKTTGFGSITNISGFGNTSVNLTTSVYDWTKTTIYLCVSSLATAKVRIIVDYNNGTPDFTYYLDGFQWEKQSTPTDYCDGSLGTGYSWTGTAHNSSSLRTSRNTA